MRKLSIYLLLSAALITSCDSDLDLNPEQSLSADIAFANYNNANGAMIGAYDLLQDLHVFGSQPQVIADFVTDNTNFSGSFPSLQEFNNFKVTEFNSTVDEVWRDSYQAILACNAVIANASGLEDGTTEQKEQLEGEARFVRAAVYFMIADLYSQPYVVSGGSNLSVPLYLEPFVGEVVLLPRNTLAEVYDQIELDLNLAAGLLPATNIQGFANANAATALLSRLYLYQEDWQAAADAANTVITNGDYALAPDLSFYNVESTEHIFSIENSAIDPNSDTDSELGSGSWDGYYTGTDVGGRGDGEFSSDLDALFAREPNDLRGSLKVDGLNFVSQSVVHTLKYNSPNDESDFAMIRMAEMYLNQAEALAQMSAGVDQVVISLVNAVRTRAGATEWQNSDFADKEALLDAISDERRKEFCFEGHRRMDLLRTGQPLRRTTPPSVADANAGVGVSAGDNLAIWPIPRQEIDINPLLVQNPGY